MREEGIEREGKVNTFSSKPPVSPHVGAEHPLGLHHFPGSEATIENRSNKEQLALVE